MQQQEFLRLKLSNFNREYWSIKKEYLKNLGGDIEEHNPESY